MDDNVVPVLFKEWRRSYDDEALFQWEEPIEEGVNENGKHSPGHLGLPVQLSPSQEKEAKIKSGKHQLNVVVSDLIPLNRSLPDYRNKRCV